MCIFFVFLGYRSESRGADYRLGDSLRNNGHESRFRNEFSSSNNLTTNVPVTATRESYSRSASRSSRREFQDGPNGYYSEFRSSSRGPGDFPRSSSRGPGDFHRSSSRGPDYYRSSGEHLLRPGRLIKSANINNHLNCRTRTWWKVSKSRISSFRAHSTWRTLQLAANCPIQIFVTLNLVAFMSFLSKDPV